MKLRTHFIIAKIAAEHTELSVLERSVFCIGSLIPDLSPMQFIHCHFYSKSGKYVLRKLEKLSGKSSLAALLAYGKMAHYVSDFCCSVHYSGSVGDIQEHILYERALNRYILKNRESLSDEFGSLSAHQNLNSVISDYDCCEKFDLHNDLSFAIKASFDVCRQACFSRKMRSQLRADIDGGAIQYGCRNTGV